MVIWTRLVIDPMAADGGIPAEPVDVVWEVATDEDLADVVARGVATTDPGTAHSVHVDVKGLDPATAYSYRFRVGTHDSPVGRARTLPAPGAGVESMRFAVANCQAYQTGFYTAAANLADEELDLVFFVGDYIYELEPSNEAREHGLPPPQTLDEFRVFYGFTKADEHLRAAHRSHTWVLTWDDHEVEDNYAGLEPGGIGRALDPESAEADFPDKRAAALPGVVGAHAGAQTGRRPTARCRCTATWPSVTSSPSPWSTTASTGTPSSRAPGPVPCPGPWVAAPRWRRRSTRTARSSATPRSAWLLDVLGGSGATWNVLVQQSIMAEVDRRPDLEGAGYSMDAWDGYVASRRRILGFVADEAVPQLRGRRGRHPHRSRRRPADRLQGHRLAGGRDRSSSPRR